MGENWSLEDRSRVCGISCVKKVNLEHKELHVDMRLQSSYINL